VWTIYGAGAEQVLLGFFLLMPGNPIYVWKMKQWADEADAKNMAAIGAQEDLDELHFGTIIRVDINNTEWA
jgi:hypothetical protein